MRMRVMLIGICVGVVGVIVLGFLGSAVAAEPHESSTDTRQRLVLAPAQRDKILAEMRLMLGSVGGILQALAADDLGAAEKAALLKSKWGIKSIRVAKAHQTSPHHSTPVYRINNLDLVRVAEVGL